MRPIVMCRNPKFSKLVMDCNLAAMAMRYPNDYVNEQYRDLRQEQIKKRSAQRNGMRKEPST